MIIINVSGDAYGTFVWHIIPVHVSASLAAQDWPDTIVTRDGKDILRVGCTWYPTTDQANAAVADWESLFVDDPDGLVFAYDRKTTT